MVDAVRSAFLSAQCPGNVIAFLGMTYNRTKRPVQRQVSVVVVQKPPCGKWSHKNSVTLEICKVKLLLILGRKYDLEKCWKWEINPVTMNNVKNSNINKV